MTFRTGLYLRTTFIFFNLIAIVLCLAGNRWYIIAFAFVVVLVFQLFLLVRYIEKTNLELAKFIEGMLTNDFTLHFNEAKWKGGFDELFAAFNKVGRAYQQARIEKEVQFQYFKMMIEQLDTGILSFKTDGEVVLMNQTAGAILEVPVQTHLSRLKLRNEQFFRAVDKAKEGESFTIELNGEREVKQLIVRVNSITSSGEKFTVVSFQDIKSEMELKEIESWHKLIRVLTHEIMNSVTPITSLSETIKMMLEDEEKIPIELNEITEEDLSDIRKSVETIRKRSEGLMHFVGEYRKLTRLHQPQKSEVHLADLIHSMLLLFQADLRKLGIEMTCTVLPENLSVNADPKLLEQVLINLITNARDALTGAAGARITIDAKKRDGKTIIEVKDNGSGIPEKIRPHVFVPFYSTKKEGSGIGLSLSRSIIRMHGGRFWFTSKPGFTSFFIEL